jgi:hypothetical protein
MWGIKTNNKSYLKCLSKSWTFHLFIKNNLRIFLREQGIISYLQLSNFKEENWKEWINHFNRYNLSPKMWCSISPHKWRFGVSEHWKRNKVFSAEKNENLTISEQTNNSSIFRINSLAEETRKSNKLLKNTLLTYKFFDSNKSIITRMFPQLNEKYLNSNIITNKIHKYIFIFNKKRIYPEFSVNKKNIFFRYNILLWFVPGFVEQRDKYKKIFNLDNSITKHKNLEIFRNKELFRDRELNQSIRQWRWKSRNFEERFKKLGNMASLMTFMQNQETMVSLSGKMIKDLDLFRLFFRRNNNFNRLAINSEHRLPRLLDDQILIYKLISTSLSFEQRLKKIANLQNVDESSLDLSISRNDKKNNILINSFNLENILLPKRRRELRIFNSLALGQEKQEKHVKLTENLLKKIQERNGRVGMNRDKIIKRFIWSSYRFEDLACMNRFWFGTMNGSRFSMLRVRIYPII